MKKIRIVLVDDHQMFRDGVKSVLSDEENMEVVGEVGNGNDLFELLKSNTPDLIITDISMPEISGIEVTKYVSENYPDIKILILSMHTNEEFITKALSSGANGYLPKDTSMNELLDAINTIYKGDNYFNKNISDTILKSIIDKSKNNQNNSKNEKLTKREKEVVQLVVDGLTNKEIADKLFISIRTVDSHKNNVMQKLNLKSSVELVKYILKNNIIDIG
ncbi:MAG: response regulator transcription factor [Bacteroidales bacterium]|nr:response regulator transcription factor [Bacteroidales bacterium]